MNLNYETVGINFNTIDKKGNKKADEIATPQDICDDMATLFDYTDCNRKIWMDMYCKTGNFLSSLKRQGVDKNNIAAICQTLQSQMLVCRKLYGKILPEVEVEIKIKSLESCKVTRRGQVYYISNWKDKVRYNYQEAYNIIKFVVMKEMERTMSLDWTTEENFKINNIIMNPPYNPSDLYIDFVELAHNIASENVVAITPAKGINGKADAKNDKFRKEIVPYISKAVLSRSGHDIFEVDENAGICYYLIDNKEHKIKLVKNICTDNQQIRSDFEEHDETALNLYNRKILSIIGKVGTLGEGFKQSLYVKNTDRGEETIAGTLGFKRQIFTGEQDRGEKTPQSNYVEVMQGEKVVGYRAVSELFTTLNLNKYKCTCSCMMGYSAMFLGKNKVIGSPYINIIGPNQVPKGSFPVLRYFDTEQEAKSFQSYIHSKLCSFLFFLGICGATITAQFFRFIPDPKVFDHIFTDEELYKKYDLTDEEISIIESIIKSR